MLATLCIQLSADGHLCCFYFLATVNNATVSVHVLIFMRKYVFTSFQCIVRSEIVEICGNVYIT